MALGLGDPALRRETWFMQEIGRDETNRSNRLWRLLPYGLVSYDGDPVRYIEPWPPSQTCAVFDGTHDPIQATVDGQGRLSRIEYCEARPFELHGFGDVDPTTLGTLPAWDPTTVATPGVPADR